MLDGMVDGILGELVSALWACELQQFGLWACERHVFDIFGHVRNTISVMKSAKILGGCFGHVRTWILGNWTWDLGLGVGHVRPALAHGSPILLRHR